MTIIFTQNKNTESLLVTDKPVLYIGSIFFSTEEKDWARRLFGVSLVITISGFNEKNEAVHSFQQQFGLGAYITPYHIQPVLDITKYFEYPHDINSSKNDSRCISWKMLFQIEGLSFLENEKLEVDMIDNRDVEESAAGWENHVKLLYNQIMSWLEDNNNYHLELGPAIETADEWIKRFNLLSKKINTADLFRTDKRVMTFIPKGFSSPGFNGRIDVISKEGSHILLFDGTVATWYLFTAKNRQIEKKLNKSEFLKLL